MAGSEIPPVFTKPAEQQVAQLAFEAIRRLENQPTMVPSVEHLKSPEIQAAIVKAVEEQLKPAQLELEGMAEKPDVASVVARTVDLVMQQTINIPRILVVRKGEMSSFKPFTLKLDSIRYQPGTDELWVQYLRTREAETVVMGRDNARERRLEDYIVSGLVDFNDISYDDHADLLYDLAGQAVARFRSYLAEGEVADVLRCYQKPIAKFIHAQMQEHYWEDVVDYEVKISKGFTELKPSAYTYSVQEPTADYRVAPTDKSNMTKYLFNSFQRCLYSVQKFASDAERRLAVILERDAIKWFKPAKGQFQLLYRHDAEYQPDFVAETDDTIYMLEPKMRKEMNDAIVIAKKEAAVKWCALATDYSATNGGKPWCYVLIPHDEIAVNITLAGLAARFSAQRAVMDQRIR
jgi:type III restriction enzyme